MVKPHYKPGENSPGGRFEIIGPRGGHTGDYVHVPRGETMPPTPKPNMGFEK